MLPRYPGVFRSISCRPVAILEKRCADPLYTNRPNSLPRPGTHFPIARTPRGLLKWGGEMLNPAMQSWGAYELARHLAEKTLAKQHPKPQPATPNPAPGSMEWFAAQEKLKNSS